VNSRGRERERERVKSRGRESKVETAGSEGSQKKGRRETTEMHRYMFWLRKRVAGDITRCLQQNKI
jgi:hypothetical protein